MLDDRTKVGLRFTRSFVAWYDLAAQALAPLLVVSHACCPLDTICHHWHFHLHLLISRTPLRVVALIVSGLIIASEQPFASVGTAERGFVGLRHNRPHSLHTIFQPT